MTIDPDITIDPNNIKNAFTQNNLSVQNSDVQCQGPIAGHEVHGVADLAEGSGLSGPNSIHNTLTINMSQFRDVVGPHQCRALKVTPDVHLGWNLCLLSLLKQNELIISTFILNLITSCIHIYRYHESYSSINC